MSIEKKIIVDEINRCLDIYFLDQIKLAKEVDQSYVDFWKEIERYVMIGGKRLRSYCFILAYLAFGGQDWTKIISVALSQEMLHAALLIHDDIIDQDFIRHGQDNLAAIKIKQYEQFDSEKAYHFGNSAALLGGDLLLSASFDLINNSNLADNLKLDLIKLHKQNIFLVSAGELMDFETSFNHYDHQKSFKIMKFKTCFYTFYYPFKTASLVNQIDIKDDLLKKFAINMGTIYQIIDDLHDLLLDEESLGKPSLSDIRENKKTAIMSTLYQESNPTNQKFIDKIMGKSVLKNEDIQSFRKILLNSTTYQDNLNLINNLKKETRTIVKKLPIEKNYLNSMFDLVDQLKLSV